MLLLVYNGYFSQFCCTVIVGLERGCSREQQLGKHSSTPSLPRGIHIEQTLILPIAFQPIFNDLQ